MNRPGIAILGGGVFAARLCEVLAGTPELPALDIRLHARRPRRLAVIADHAARRVRRLRPDWSIRASPVLETALQDARVVVILVRVGGLEARARDERLTARFGLVGDEGLGVGGVANAWRTLPVLSRMAERISRVAPGSEVLNLVAPLGITTRLLLDAGLRAVGLCELPLVTRRRLLESASTVPTPPALRYAGLNHLGWFWARGPSGRRALAAAARDGLADAAVLARFGAAPLHYYYELFDLDADRPTVRPRAPGRAAYLLDLGERALARMRSEPGAPIDALAERPTPWFEWAVAPALTAILTGASRDAFANVRNGDLVPELPGEIVVEFEARFEGNAVRPRRPGPLPKAVAAFLRRLARAEDLVYRAASARDEAGIADGLRASPLSPPERRIPELVRALCSKGEAILERPFVRSEARPG